MFRIIKETEPELYEQYKQKTKEINRENAKQWRNKNKEKFYSITKKYKQKTFICSCGESVTNNSKSYHVQSMKHFKRLKQRNTNNEREEAKKQTEQDEINRLSAEFDKLLGLTK